MQLNLYHTFRNGDQKLIDKNTIQRIQKISFKIGDNGVHPIFKDGRKLPKEIDQLIIMAKYVNMW